MVASPGARTLRLSEAFERGAASAAEAHQLVWYKNPQHETMATIYDFERVVILGGPGCGKSTLATKYSMLSMRCYSILHTDHAMLPDLRASGKLISSWFDRPAPWVIEGVTAGYALEHWLRSNRGTPCDLVLALWRPYKQITNEQGNMLRILRRHWREVEPFLVERGVRVHNLLFGLNDVRKAS